MINYFVIRFIYLVGIINFGKFYVFNDKFGNNFVSVFDNSVFSSVYVQIMYIIKFFNLLYVNEMFDRESIYGVIVISGGDDQRCIDGVRVYVRLVVVVYSNQSLVSDDIGDVDFFFRRVGDEIFNVSSIEEFNVGYLKYFGYDS